VVFHLGGVPAGIPEHAAVSVDDRDPYPGLFPEPGYEVLDLGLVPLVDGRLEYVAREL